MERKNETIYGGEFGPLTIAGGRLSKRKNSMMSWLSEKMPAPADSLINCHREYNEKRVKMTPQQQEEWLLVLRLAEVGVNAILTQLRESAALNKDAGVAIDEGGLWRI